MQGIYLVTDTAACLGKPLNTVVADAVRAGAACVQLREKQASTRVFLEKAQELKAVLKPSGIPLIINDRVDIALAAGAAGVHLGQSDMPCDHARDILGPGAIVGLSVETWKDVEAAEKLDVDYLGVSPVFPTPTKTDTREPWGLDGLHRISTYSRHLLVAIGGIDHSNAATVLSAGAHGLAVVSAICSAENVFAATRGLVRIYDQVRAKKEG